MFMVATLTGGAIGADNPPPETSRSRRRADRDAAAIPLANLGVIPLGGVTHRIRQPAVADERDLPGQPFKETEVDDPREGAYQDATDFHLKHPALWIFFRTVEVASVPVRSPYGVRATLL